MLLAVTLCSSTVPHDDIFSALLGQVARSGRIITRRLANRDSTTIRKHPRGHIHGRQLLEQ
jgi:hypothetical protein